MRRRFCAIAIAAACAGCGGPPAETPERAISELSRALREGRIEDAYALMSEDYRRRVSLDELRARIRDGREEIADTAAALAAPDGAAEITASIPYADGESVELLFEDGAWRIASPVLDYYDQSTPRAALRSFVRAMERGRYDVVMRMVPNADREGMSVEQMRLAWSGEGREEIERLVAILRASLDRPIEEVGDHATMPYGERFVARLVREDGVWKVEDPD